MYLAVGFSTTNELECAQVMAALPVDKLFFWVTFTFLWQALWDLILSKSFVSDVLVGPGQSTQQGASGSQNIRYRQDTVCISAISI